MSSFLVFPNYSVLSKYLSFTDFGDINAGHPVDVGRYYSDESKVDILSGFKAIIERYGLHDHYENLLFITLALVEDFDLEVIHAYDEYDNALRTRDLALLYLGLADQCPIFTVTINKVFNLTNTTVTGLIRQSLRDAIQSNKLLVKDFGALPLSFTDSKGDLLIESVQSAASVKLQKKDTIIRQRKVQLVAEFCFAIRPYLNNETALANDSGSTFSDKQLNFFYEILQLHNLWVQSINISKEIDYEHKDLMRTRLMNYAKSVKKKGNKK